MGNKIFNYFNPYLIMGVISLQHYGHYLQISDGIVKLNVSQNVSITCYIFSFRCSFLSMHVICCDNYK